MSDANTLDEQRQADIDRALACNADDMDALNLANGTVDENGYAPLDHELNEKYGFKPNDHRHYQSVPTPVANCYNGIERTPGFLDHLVGKAKGAFDSARHAVASVDMRPDLVQKVDDALDRANTSDSNMNRRWQAQEANAGIAAAPPPSPGGM